MTYEFMNDDGVFKSAEGVLQEALDAARKAVAEYKKQYNNVEPMHLNCGFSWVQMNFNRNKACEANKEFIKYIKNELKQAGYKYDSGGNLCFLDGTFATYGSKASLKSDGFGSPDYLPSTWHWWDPGDSGGWQDMDCKHAGSMAFAYVLRSYGIKVSTGTRLD